MGEGFLIPCHSIPWFWFVDAAVVNEYHYEQLVLKHWGVLAVWCAPGDLNHLIGGIWEITNWCVTIHHQCFIQITALSKDTFYNPYSLLC